VKTVRHGRGDPSTDDHRSITVFATKGDGGNPYAAILYDEVRRRGVTIIDVGSWRTRDLLARPAKGPRILHLQWGGEYMFAFPSVMRAAPSVCRYLLNLILLRLGGIRIVWTFHEDAVSSGCHPRLAAAYHWTLIRFVANRTVALTPGARDLVQKRCGPRAARRVRVVPQPNYDAIYGLAPTSLDARRRLGLPPDARLLLYFGHIRPRKGVPDLLQAFSTLPGDDLTLVVAGSVAPDDLQHEIEQAARADPRVTLRLGRVADEEVAPLLAAADVVVLPYRESLNSAVLYLAISYNRPVVAPRLGSFAELAATGKLPGLAYDPGGLACALSTALGAGPEERARWSRVMEDHRATGKPDLVADALLRCYRDAAR